MSARSAAFVVAGALVAARAAEFPSVRLTRLWDGVDKPTHIASAGDGSRRLFVTEQPGRIRVIRDGVLAERPFLDIRDRVSLDSERGLLSVAFPPGFAAKRYFYVNYTDLDGHTIVSRFSLTDDSDLADPSSEAIVLRIEQPFANHNGGQIAFSPTDGWLYVGMGDGGGGGDPLNAGQDEKLLLGKLLRVDVEAGSRTPEIRARGLRNPWRFSFDRSTGDLYIADVGQDLFEEVSFTPASSLDALNFGWNLMEGRHCFAEPDCSAEGLTTPVVEYGREDGCSVIGGHVYRGARYPDWSGFYFFGDICSGRLWALIHDGEKWENRRLLDTGLGISTFGEDEEGEIYLASHGDGAIFRLDRVPDESRAP